MTMHNVSPRGTLKRHRQPIICIYELTLYRNTYTTSLTKDKAKRKEMFRTLICLFAALSTAAIADAQEKKDKKESKIADQTLGEIQVTGRRSTMKLKVDRKDFDVASLITTAGQTATDVLENIPSVDVDNDGNVSLRGNSSVEVWINGRPSGLTSDNRAQILQQLPAESIERIEVIDNPSAKFSAEGSAGIINIVLKKDRRKGYYGSLQAGADTRGGANTSFNINYNSSKLDAYFNIGYRHMENKGSNESRQDNLSNGTLSSYEYHDTENNRRGNMMFTRAGLTFHATDKDDFSVSGMLFTGKHKEYSSTPYYYGVYNGLDRELTSIRLRNTYSGGPMNMYNAEFNYRHSFTDKHYLDFTVSHGQWGSDNDNVYQDSIYFVDNAQPSTSSYQSRPLNIKNHNTEIKLDYENPLTEHLKLESGYMGDFSRENTPQLSYEAANWNGNDLTEEKSYFNRFKYDEDRHALYFTLSYNHDKFSVMTGLRGEYWRVKTTSLNWDEEHGMTPVADPYKKDYFQLFPSVFMSYQLTKTQQLQLNYTRRLRRPWGGELNSFRNTSDASIVSFGNPELTPEFSNSFSLNYLKQWDMHSLLVSAYYRPTSDVIQRINYRSQTDQMMYRTPMNVAKSTSTGLELTGKNKIGRVLDLTTNVNMYYYKLNAFNYYIDGQTVSGEAQDNFTWNARIIAAITLPYDISVQASGRYNSRSVITQGHRPSTFGVDLGVKKNFLNRKLILSVNCRDVFNSRKWETYTASDTFERYQLNKRSSRRVNFTVTWNFGNQSGMKKKQERQQSDDDEMGSSMGGYEL